MKKYLGNSASFFSLSKLSDFFKAFLKIPIFNWFAVWPSSQKVIKLILALLLTVLTSTAILLFWPKHSQKWLGTPSLAQSKATNSHPATEPNPLDYGRWETVIPKNQGAAVGSVLGLQGVHVALLPSGKVFMASGSSWRNRLNRLKDGQASQMPETEDGQASQMPKTEDGQASKMPEAELRYYPDSPLPEPGKGLFIRDEKPFEEKNIGTYYSIVNNVGIYDPGDPSVPASEREDSFYRIPHPIPRADPKHPGWFAPNDLFCTGHQHLPDGNVLFTGGTQYYDPHRTGTRTSYIFDWKQEMAIDWNKFDWSQKPEKTLEETEEQEKDFYPWKFSGFMKRGRWYPHMVPLLDGRLAVFGGFVGFDPSEDGQVEAPYQFEINHYVEFFDEKAFGDQKKAWRSVDVKNLPNSPFNTPLDLNLSKISQARKDNMSGNPEPSETPAQSARKSEDFTKDAFKLYPNNYLLKDGRIYMTREGEWVSLRTNNTEYMRRTKNTYFMEVEGSREDPKVKFSMGPKRPDTITSYGTTVLDPNADQIDLFGGQAISAGTLSTCAKLISIWNKVQQRFCPKNCVINFAQLLITSTTRRRQRTPKPNHQRLASI